MLLSAMRGLVAFAILLMSVSSLAQYPGAQRTPEPWRKGYDSIKLQDSRQLVEFLAGPSFSGRNALSMDFALAAGACSEMFRTIGLTPAGDSGSYFQKFQMEAATVIPDRTRLLDSNGRELAKFGTEFQAGCYASGTSKFRVVFLRATELSDVSQLDWSLLRGSYVVATAGALQNPTVRENVVTKRLDHGCYGVVSVRQGNPTATTRSQRVANIPDPRHGPVASLQMSANLCDEIAKLSNAKNYLNVASQTASLEPSIDLKVDAVVTTVTTEHINVVGKVEGSDPILKNECVVIGAHLDHMGITGAGTLFGADDNASGSVAAIMIGRALVQNPIKPKRTVIIGLWTMEERGTYGSFAYSGKPHLPIRETVAYLNMDMVGRNENSGCDIPEFNERAVYPGSVNLNSVDLQQVLVQANRFVNLDLRPDKEDRIERSDTRNFVFRGVPTVKVFTGEHEDYHRAGDVHTKLNYQKLVSIAKWVYLTTQELAAAKARPKFERQPFVLPENVRLAGYATTEVELPRNARIVVSVFDDDVKLGSETHAAYGKRIPYQILIARDKLRTSKNALLRLEVFSSKKLLLTTEQAIAVPPNGWTRAQTVALKEVSP